MGLEAIKDSIRKLSDQDRIALENWLAEEWDAEIERDVSPGGAGRRILAELDAQIEAGNVDRFTRPRG